MDSKAVGLARSAKPDSSLLLERTSSDIGHAGGYSIGIRGKRADVGSPHTIRNARMGLGRGVLCRDMVTSSHGLSCECGCRDQRGRHEGNFGHLFLHMVIEAKERSTPCCEDRPALGDISSGAFNKARASAHTPGRAPITRHAAASRLSNGAGRRRTPNDPVRVVRSGPMMARSTSIAQALFPRRCARRS